MLIARDIEPEQLQRPIQRFVMPLGGIDEHAVEIEQDARDLFHGTSPGRTGYLSPFTLGIFTTTVVVGSSVRKSVASPGARMMMSPAANGTPFIVTRPEAISVSSVATRWTCSDSTAPAG